MNTLLQDIRYALRMLRKSPGFTAIALLTLALGIGANTAIFSVIDAVLLKPLPYRAPDRLVVLFETESAEGQFPLTGQDFLDWRHDNQTFEDMSAFSYPHPFSAGGAGDPEQISARPVEANFFSLLGVPPQLGRTFAEGEDTAAKNHVAVLSNAFWITHFGGDSQAVGKSIALNGESYAIIGVMPAWYSLPAKSDLWIPIDMSPKGLGPRGQHYLSAIGRLKSGVTLGQARADLKNVAAGYERQFPATNQKVSAIVIPLREILVGSSQSQLYIMFGAVALVLLIACANVANLLLARSTSRRREMALRGAVGATRWRLARQLLTESVLLSVLGGALGVAIAYYGVGILSDAQGFTVPQPSPVSVDLRVLAFTLGISVVIGMLFGLAPAMQVVEVNLSDELKSKGVATQSVAGRGRIVRDILVAGEIALSLALLAGAGLLLRTFSHLRSTDVGVRGNNTLTASIYLPEKKYTTLDMTLSFATRLTDSLESTPGIRAAALATDLPPDGGSNGYVKIPGQVTGEMEGPLVEWNYITPDYFRALGVPLLQGRVFTSEDQARTAATVRRLTAIKDEKEREAEGKKDEGVAVISAAMARRFWPNQDPVGKSFDHDDFPHRVIGIVGDVRNRGLRETAMPGAYFPISEMMGDGGGQALIVLQAAGTPESVLSALRQRVKDLDDGIAVFRVRTVPQLVAESMTDTSYEAALLGTLAALALILAAVGTYGVMAYVAAQRTNEIGIRMALGAQRSEILRMVLRQGMSLVGAGIAIGLIATLALARLMGDLLFGVAPFDPWTYAAVSLVLAAVAFIACYVPAWRAMRVDPIIALRYE